MTELDALIYALFGFLALTGIGLMFINWKGPSE